MAAGHQVNILPEKLTEWNAGARYWVAMTIAPHRTARTATDPPRSPATLSLVSALPMSPPMRPRRAVLLVVRS